MAGAPSWPRYPPCASGTCTDVVCCTLGQGSKFRWPELIRKQGGIAKAIIEREAPYATVVFLVPDMVRLNDFCCNRVFVVLDGRGNVVDVPVIG